MYKSKKLRHLLLASSALISFISSSSICYAAAADRMPIRVMNVTDNDNLNWVMHFNPQNGDNIILSARQTLGLITNNRNYDTLNIYGFDGSIIQVNSEDSSINNIISDTSMPWQQRAMVANNNQIAAQGNDPNPKIALQISNNKTFTINGQDISALGSIILASGTSKIVFNGNNLNGNTLQVDANIFNNGRVGGSIIVSNDTVFNNKIGYNIAGEAFSIYAIEVEDGKSAMLKKDIMASEIGLIGDATLIIVPSTENITIGSSINTLDYAADKEGKIEIRGHAQHTVKFTQAIGDTDTRVKEIKITDGAAEIEFEEKVYSKKIKIGNNNVKFGDDVGLDLNQDKGSLEFTSNQDGKIIICKLFKGDIETANDGVGKVDFASANTNYKGDIGKANHKLNRVSFDNHDHKFEGNISSNEIIFNQGKFIPEGNVTLNGNIKIDGSTFVLENGRNISLGNTEFNNNVTFQVNAGAPAQVILTGNNYTAGLGGATLVLELDNVAQNLAPGTIVSVINLNGKVINNVQVQAPQGWNYADGTLTFDRVPPVQRPAQNNNAAPAGHAPAPQAQPVVVAVQNNAIAPQQVAIVNVGAQPQVIQQVPARQGLVQPEVEEAGEEILAEEIVNVRGHQDNNNFSNNQVPQNNYIPNNDQGIARTIFNNNNAIAQASNLEKERVFTAVTMLFEDFSQKQGNLIENVPAAVAQNLSDIIIQTAPTTQLEQKRTAAVAAITKSVISDSAEVEHTIEILEKKGINLGKISEAAYRDEVAATKTNSEQALLFIASMQAVAPEKREEVLKQVTTQALDKVVIGDTIGSAVRAEMSSRLDQVSSMNTIGFGVASGEEDTRIPLGIWVSGLYGQSKQSQLKAVPGYNGKLSGGTIGFDANITDNSLVGIAYTNANSDFNYSGAKKGDKTTARSDVFSLYAQHEINNQWIINGLLSYAASDVKTKTQKNTSIATGKFKNTSYGAEGGMAYKIPIAENISILPSVALRYAHFKDSGYTEKGAGVSNIQVAGKTGAEITGVLGAKMMMKHMVLESVNLIPILHASLETSLSHKQQKAKGKFVWSDKYFESENLPAREKIAYNIGASVLASKGNMEMIAGYNLHARKKYLSHQGSLKLKVMF